MACDDARPKGLDIVPDTHVHPNYATHPVSKDRYSAYNKPLASSIGWSTPTSRRISS